MRVGTLGTVIQAGQRFEDPSQIDFLGVWDNVKRAAYDLHSMITEDTGHRWLVRHLPAAEPGPGHPTAAAHRHAARGHPRAVSSP